MNEIKKMNKLDKTALQDAMLNELKSNGVNLSPHVLMIVQNIVDNKFLIEQYTKEIGNDYLITFFNKSGNESKAINPLITMRKNTYELQLKYIKQYNKELGETSSVNVNMTGMDLVNSVIN